jgi:hypothetical protein
VCVLLFNVAGQHLRDGADASAGHRAREDAARREDEVEGGGPDRCRNCRRGGSVSGIAFALHQQLSLITFLHNITNWMQLKARLHVGISHGTSHGISHGTRYVPQKVRGTSRVNGGISMGLTEYHGISYGMSHGTSYRVNGP